MPRTDAATTLIVEVFRLYGGLVAAGDDLVADLGLTSARWQVLGAIMMQRAPAPVVRIAEALQLTRQSVQRIVDELEAEGVLAFQPNPHHRRAKLVAMTQKGRALFEAAMARQRPWAQNLIAGVTQKELAEATHVIARLRARLERDRGRTR